MAEISLREALIEAAARAMTDSPDRCVFGTGWAGVGRSGFTCSRRAWEEQKPRATAALEAILAKLLSEIDAVVPDSIDLFRLIHGAGRSNIAKTRAVDCALEPLRVGLATLASPSAEA